MAWIADFPELNEARGQARKALHVPIGMTSPLWLAFGAATTAGVAWWWMTRWTRALNIEAMTGAAKAQVEAVEAFIEKESQVATHAIEAAEAVLEAVAAIEPLAPVAPEPEAVPEPVLEAAPEPGVAPELLADDLTRLAGVGPKLAAALAERGVTTFAQLAAWTEEHADAFDAELSLKGRVARDAWIAQARRLAST
jgi:predicted flap endonuclease-1-like 5' DNA nuclease